MCMLVSVGLDKITVEEAICCIGSRFLSPSLLLYTIYSTPLALITIQHTLHSYAHIMWQTHTHICIISNLPTDTHTQTIYTYTHTVTLMDSNITVNKPLFFFHSRCYLSLIGSAKTKKGPWMPCCSSAHSVYRDALCRTETHRGLGYG